MDTAEERDLHYQKVQKTAEAMIYIQQLTTVYAVEQREVPHGQ